MLIATYHDGLQKYVIRGARIATPHSVHALGKQGVGHSTIVPLGTPSGMYFYLAIPLLSPFD